MAQEKSVQLLLNTESTDHKTKIEALFENAQRFECMVAFAKVSGWNNIKTALENALTAGLEARLAVGLDFFHTDPDLLRTLFRMSKKADLELYLSNSNSTFHPKIYAFESIDGSKVVVGSANLTQGGLIDNYEASVLVDDRSGAMMGEIIEYFDDLIENKEIVLATKSRIDAYAKDHEINAAWEHFARRRVKHSFDFAEVSLDILDDFLRMMQKGDELSDFAKQVNDRRKNLAAASTQLRSIAEWDGGAAEDFLSEYQDLINLFHSGGLHRAKTRITRQREEFVQAVVETIDHDDLSAHDAFENLHAGLLNIKGAGINLLTEILHTLDNTRFAVMNQNAVAGLRLAGYDQFPTRPSKGSVTPDMYQSYCDCAEDVRNELGLRDFTELDALFNYVYWHEDLDNEGDSEE